MTERGYTLSLAGNLVELPKVSAPTGGQTFDSKQLIEKLDDIKSVELKEPSRLEQLIIDLATRNPKPGRFLTVFGDHLASRRKFTMAELVLRRAMAETQADAWRRDCRVWLYRAPEKPWPAAEIDMAVPLSPIELTQKTEAAFHHKSQRSQSPASTSLLEGWQQAEQQNQEFFFHT